MVVGFTSIVLLYTGSAGVLGVVYMCDMLINPDLEATPLRLTFTV